MALSPGTRLGPYEILAPLGAGGMGEVYCALDLKLNREVALKVLPAAFAGDPDRVARLKREARMLAAVNHPNIGAIYDLEEFEGNTFLALEFVPGNTLGQRLARGPLSVHEAVGIFLQIAEALEAAHDKSVTHRDLKPANIKITPAGKVKLLDFGLAEGGAHSEDPDLAGTKTVYTSPGAVVGTPHYMSPEQARGLRLDKRTDIWSFGCVLYEALAGRQLFSGKTASDVIASILRDAPNLDGLPQSAPSAIRRLLQRCLRHDPARRLRDIGDARIELEEVQAAPAAAARRAPRGPLWILAGAAAGAVLVASWFLVARGGAPRANIQLQRVTDFVGMEESPAISPDGKTVAFVARTGNRRHIWIRLLAGGVPFQVTKDDADHEHPRWTPDSGSLIYYTPSATLGEQGAIWEIPALGGARRRICSATGGGDVGQDGRIAVFQIERGRLRLAHMARDGSGLLLVKELSAGSVYETPRWSPDDRWIAFQAGSVMVYERVLHVIAATGGEPRKIARGNLLRGHAWMADGSALVYSSSLGSTVAYPPVFNLRTVSRDGGRDRQLTFGDVSYLSPDVHSSGRLVASRVKSQSNIWRFPTQGSPAENMRSAVQITRQTSQAQTPSVSPDGAELVYLSDSGGHGNLWVVKKDGLGVRQLTFERDPAAFVGVPVWSPAGNSIAFIQTRAGKTEQWLIGPDGNGLRPLLTGGTFAYWSGDGRWLYYTASRQGNYCIEKLSVSGGQPVNVRCDSAFAPAVSPDGSALYFATPAQRVGGIWDWEVRRASPESGQPSVLARIPGSRIPVEPLNIHAILSPDGNSLAIPLTDRGTSDLWIIPTGGGSMQPVTDFSERTVVMARRVSWSPDGKHIYAAVAETDADVVMFEGLLHGW